MKLQGVGRDVEIKPLTEETVVDIVADLLGEIILFSILALLVFAEYERHHYVERKKVQLLISPNHVWLIFHHLQKMSYILFQCFANNLLFYYYIITILYKLLVIPYII